MTGSLELITVLLISLCSVLPLQCTSVTEQTVTVFVGESVELLCLSGDMSGVSWLHQAATDARPERQLYSWGSVSDDYRSRFGVDTTRYRHHNLNISNASLSDTGKYSCVEQQGTGRRHVFHLKVVEVGDYYQRVELGEAVTFRCRTDHEQHVVWLRQDITSNHQDYIYTLGSVLQRFRSRFTVDRFERGHYNLVISSVDLRDAGTYCCLEENGQGARHTFELEVTDVRYSQRRVYVGESITLPCSSELDAPVDWIHTIKQSKRYIFSRGSVLQRYRSRLRVDRSERGHYDLVISSVSVRDSGTYSCVENGGPGGREKRRNFQMNVIEPRPADTNLTAAVGETVRLPCVTDLSAGGVDWIHCDVEDRCQRVYTSGAVNFEFRTRFGVDRTEPGHFDLVLANFTGKDEGRYVCVEIRGDRQQHSVQLLATVSPAVKVQSPSDVSQSADKSSQQNLFLTSLSIVALCLLRL